MAGMVEKAYSEAVFQLGKEENCIDSLCGEIEQLSSVFAENPELTKLLCAPTVSKDEKTAMINRIFKGKISDYALHFLLVLTEKKRINCLSGIAREVKAQYNDYNGILEVSVTTAEPLKKAIKDKLVKKLESTTGKKIVLVEKTDKSILGGIILNYGNTQLDSSVKSRLDGMRAQIRSIVISAE